MSFVDGSHWHRRILIPLCFVHFVIIIPRLLAAFVEPGLSQSRKLPPSPLLHRISSLLGLVLGAICESWQIIELRKGCLTTSSYLLSTCFQAIVLTWSLGSELWVWRQWKLPLPERDVVIVSLEASTFYLSFAYAVYIWTRQRRQQRILINRGISTLEGHAPLGSLVLPAKLNPAQTPRSEAPLVIDILRWVQEDYKCIANRPWLSKTPLPYFIWALKCAFAGAPICFFLFFDGLLPGEITKKLSQTGVFSLDSWNYPTPNLIQKDRYVDDESETNPTRPVSFFSDGESETDALSLRTVTEDAAERPRPVSSRARSVQPSPNRLLGPRYLCFLNHPSNLPHAYTTKKVHEWRSENQTHIEPDYIFISYTRQQFYSQIQNDPAIAPWELARRRAVAEGDKQILTRFAVQSARDAGVPAFWIDFECVRPESETREGSGDMEDVYRICDIVRASHSLTIISGPRLNEALERADVNDVALASAEWLLDWGRRLWTLPEAVLCPWEHRISIYALGRDGPEKIAKRNLPSRLWDDAGTIRQLIDHYEGSLQLTKLELISIALECLARRQTEKRHAGDVAYALMGLLRLRPGVDNSDSDFQAFARLSLANDSDRVLERLISLRSPAMVSASWHDMHDVWDAKLWHIDPMFQVLGLGRDNTVVLGDAVGTQIDWVSLKMVHFITTSRSSFRPLRWIYIRFTSVFVTFVAFSFLSLWMRTQARFGLEPDETWRILILILGGILLPLTLPVPWILSGGFRGEIISAQARVFGLLGVADLDVVETHLFGDACGRLSWSSNSTVSPSTSAGESQDPRPVYTLVDTLTMTLTTFHASDPPTMLFVGGRERGLLRILLCSYNVARQTFAKEAVVRMEGAMTTRLQRLDRFRFTLQTAVRGFTDSVADGSDHDEDDDPDMIELPDIPEFLSLD